MMATASPRFKRREIPDKTVRGPRGVGYSLARLEASSINTRRSDASVHFEGSRGHSRRAVVLANSLRTSFTEFFRARGVIPQREDSLDQTGSVVRFHQGSAAGLLEDLRSCSPSRLDHGNSVRHRLQQRHALRFVVGGGDAKDIEFPEEVDLLLPVKHTPVPEFVSEASLLHPAFDATKVFAVFGREVAGSLQFCAGKFGFAPQPDVGLGQIVQALFWRNTCEVADRENVRAHAGSGMVTLEVDAKRHNMHLVLGDAKVSTHELRVIFADR